MCCQIVVAAERAPPKIAAFSEEYGGQTPLLQ